MRVILGMSLPLGQFGKIALSWAVLTGGGVYAFVLSKNSIDKNRYDSMQVRERMRKSNTGEYDTIDNRRFGG